jgi:hypothetical protein
MQVPFCPDNEILRRFAPQNEVRGGLTIYVILSEAKDLVFRIHVSFWQDNEFL